MKLVETPINSNLDLNSLYPNITGYLFGKKAVKHFKLYSLDYTQIIYADVFDKINVVMVNPKKKINKREIDFVIKRLLQSTREEVTVHLGIQNEMKKKGILFSEPRKDIIVVQKKIEE
ncbi:DUF1827 family protein [Enterococcus sp. LJL128]|uniref:DUF1827 family protein n=1 Tax=Enterococcus sp. LJL51 TaxID=3416656 RepID=UPI003CF5D7BD